MRCRTGLDLGPAITKAKAQALAAPSARTGLIGSAFQALNRSNSGRLSAAEMRPFAEITGFEGSDEDWRKEFELLRQECPAGYIDFMQFQRLVNDTSENGCYCTDDDLRLVVEKQSVPNGHDGTVVMPPGNQASATDLGRRALITAAFHALNRSGTGHLSATEMRPFAELTGFSGTDREWQEEFELVRKECAGSSLGIPLAEFERLVNDESEDGCYASDDILRHVPSFIESKQSEISSSTGQQQEEAATTAKAPGTDATKGMVIPPF
eukprot:s247_g30.t3